jgi:hypothetical protein
MSEECANCAKARCLGDPRTRGRATVDPPNAAACAASIADRGQMRESARTGIVRIPAVFFS